MAKVINFNYHPLVQRKKQMDVYVKKCMLINNPANSLTCSGYSYECRSCPVPKYFKEARIGLTKLILIGEP